MRVGLVDELSHEDHDAPQGAARIVVFVLGAI
jgi:hypothetical protein